MDELQNQTWSSILDIKAHICGQIESENDG